MASTSTGGERAQGVRARVRAELVLEIKAEARRQITDSGAPGLSLRAVARELGMASSAIYRYFPSRDELLTAMIIDSYDDLGAAAEAADGCCGRQDLAGRWAAVCRAVRTWALGHPNEYALLYGSPVPGYRAPDETIGPAGRVTSVLVGVITDAARTGRLRSPWRPGEGPDLSPAAASEVAGAAHDAMPEVAPDALVRAVMAWTQLFGLVSFELFGHLENVVDDRVAMFDQAVAEVAAFVGLV